MVDERRRKAIKRLGAGVLAIGGLGAGTATAQDSVATVTFNDQNARGVTVNVAETLLPDGGFVVIHDERLLDGEVLASVVGNTGYKEPGEYTNLRIPVEKDPRSGEELLIAMPHRNTNTSRKYDFVTSGGEEDPPYVDPNDTNGDGFDVVIDTATVTF